VLTASAFGGLLASAIANMDGLGGLHNWQWIFVLEGILTVLIGIAAFFFLSDFPEEAKWLTEEERRFVIQRAGDHKVAVPITTHDLLVFFKDVKNILAGIMYLCIVLPIYCKFSPKIPPSRHESRSS
jgi:MFS family permease